MYIQDRRIRLCSDAYKVTPARGQLIPSLNFGNYTPNGIADLPGPLTINGQTVLPMFRYNGKDATISSWPADGYGSTISIAGSGNDPLVNQGSPLLGSVDDSVKFNAGKSYQASSAATYDITTEDVIFELIFRYSNAITPAYFMSKGSPPLGWYFYLDNANHIGLSFGGALAACQSTASLVNMAWYHALFFCDKSASIGLYINGVYDAQVAFASNQNIANSSKFTIGALSDLTSGKADNALAYVSMYKKASWLDTHLQAAVAKERFAQAIGTAPLSSRGTSVPTVATRASSAYLRKDQKLYRVGDHWPRLEHVTDANGDSFKGYHSEASETNKMLQSCTLNTTWTARGTVAVTENTTDTTDPEGVNSASKLTGIDAGANDVYLHLGDGTFSNSVDLAAGVWIKRISTSGVISFNNSQDATGVFGKWNIDLSTLGPDWVRITRENISTYGTVVGEYSTTGAGNSGLQFYKVSGTGTLSFYIWNCMLVENGSLQVGSDIGPTTTAAVTRAADTLYYKIDDGAIRDGRGAISFDLLLPDATPTSAIEILELSDGGSSSDRIRIYVDTDGTIKASLHATGGTTRTATVSGDCADWISHSINLQWQPGQFVIRRDGVAGTDIIATVAADIPGDIDRLTYGTARIRNVRTYLEPYYRGELS